MMNATKTATAQTETPALTRTAIAQVSSDLGSPAGDSASGRLNSALLPTPHPASPGKHTATDDAQHRTVPPERATRLPRDRFVIPGGAVVLVLLICLGFRLWAHERHWVKTDNAFVAAHIHSVSSRVAGTIREVLVDENQSVTAGSVLARLDARDFEVHRQQAVAQLAQARAQAREADARVAQARALVAAQQANATKAKKDLLRADSLYRDGSGAISKQELDLAQANSDAASAALQGTQAALASATASAAAALAQEQVATSSLQDAELQLSYTVILAPATGRIGKKNLEDGNRVQPGQNLLALVQPEVWVVANFKETQLNHLRPSQSVRVRIDAFPGRTFKGTVDGLSPASGAQFALLPPDNATGNFTRIVQRVPVKIVLDRQGLGDCEGRIMAGMSAVVEVKVRE